MAKFGLFTGSIKGPTQEYEGDYMKQEGQYVTILKRNANTSMADEQVSAIHLDKNQSVKKISD